MNSVKDLLLADFNLYRRYMFPNQFFGKWQDSAGVDMMAFKRDMDAGNTPALLLSCPPQHGKSEISLQFISWLIANDPLNCQAAYASVSKSLCRKAILKIRSIIYSPRYISMFGALQVKKDTEGAIYFGEKGMMLATTVSGQIVGETIRFILIDDPIKNRRESKNPLIKSRARDWFDADVCTRLTFDGGIMSIQTRWAVDDLYAHILDRYPDARSINFKAIDDSGEALFPELKPIEFLIKRREAMRALDWASLYMGLPTVDGGELFDVDKIRFYSDQPKQFDTVFAVSDTASTAKNYSDYTVIASFGITSSGDLYVLDVMRDKIETPFLESRILDFWGKNKTCQYLSIENKSSGIGLIQSLKVANLPVRVIQRGAGQVVLNRALDACATVYEGRVHFPSWLRDSEIMQELRAFPSAPHDDFVSVLCDGIEELRSRDAHKGASFNTKTFKRGVR